MSSLPTIRVTGSLSRLTGSANVTLGNGHAGAPAFTFASSQNSGMFLAGNTIGISSNGAQVASFGSGNLVVSGNIDLGSSSGSIILPQSTTRPVGTTMGQLRFNTLYDTTESFDGQRWLSVSQPSSYAPPADPIFAVDAENSYPGSGTTWTNLVSGANNMSLSNVTYSAGSSSAPGYMSFNGTTSYAESSITNTAGAWAHSVSFWMNLTTSQSAMPAWPTGTIFQIGNVNATSQYSAFHLENNSTKWYFFDNDTYISGNLFTAGSWYHIVLTYNGGDATIANKLMYINNAAKAFTGRGGSGALNLAANSQITIGKDKFYASYHAGRIANFQIWNRVLSVAEVDSLYNAHRYRFRTDAPVNLTVNTIVTKQIYHLNLYTVPSAYLNNSGSYSYTLTSQPLGSSGYYYLVWGSNYNTNFPPILQNTVQYKVPVPGLYYVRLTVISSISSDLESFISKNKGIGLGSASDLNSTDGLGPVATMKPATGLGGTISAIIPMTTSDFICLGFFVGTLNISLTARTSAQITLIAAY